MQFNPSQNYVLEDDRVLLRPLMENDVSLLEHFVVQEPEIWKYSLIRIDDVKSLRDYINTAVAARAAGNEYPFIIFDKKLNAYAGSTRFYDIQPQYNNLQLGYTWYGKNFQGTGLNKHCKYLLLQLAFETLGVERIEFRADNANERSIAAMKSIGCTVEGISRSHLPKPDGRRRDSVILSILKDEWTSGLKEGLSNKLS